MSQRQFERKFKEHVGFSPRLFTKICRFEATLSSLLTPAPLVQIALNAGYFDQAHFNHDFKTFTGMHPKDYRKIISILPTATS
ncbi:MAG TPA: helix-turn-helix domain-containing protein [Chitinophaga sp.]|uniref:helix-turn-helix domain-containing protein n=1 Tax=Chitinophaga sp. TaxID=1869181 RepID=UPI002C01CEDE|nr:helix-turn-helix domain-containing protein [Chitinophaga sp.]HVI45704.1 helix-turn-helix domain-containing protein [Chitinophaga sp.]